MNWRPATSPEHALERVRTGLGATHGQKASTRPASYAHHQTDLEPEWVVRHTPLQRAHNEGIRA